MMCARYKQMIQTLKQSMTVIVESLLNKFEEDQLKKEETHGTSQRKQSSSHYTDNCSDSDSSFNQVRSSALFLIRARKRNTKDIQKVSALVYFLWK